jgi:hypothetical protein
VCLTNEVSEKLAKYGMLLNNHAKMVLILNFFLKKKQNGSTLWSWVHITEHAAHIRTLAQQNVLHLCPV